MHPSHSLYQALQTAYDHFNRELFDDRLPAVMFTVQRQNDVLGYFAPERWVSPNGERCHEIAINPAHMAQSRVIDVLQTLAHEMAHCWQYCFGKPGRRCYHNKEWARKMIAIGLQPSSTGEPGGDVTGQHMSDYALEGGRFMRACEALVRNNAFRLPWIYRLSLPNGISSDLNPTSDETSPAPEAATLSSPAEFSLALTPSPAPEAFLQSTYRDVLPEGTFVEPPLRARSKVKYECQGCYVGVWGKPGIRLICGDCRMELRQLS